MKFIKILTFLAAVCFIAYAAPAQALDAAVQAKVDAKKAEIASWGKDPALVSAVKAFNAAKPDYAQGMDQKTWEGLTIVDPKVRAAQNSDAGKFLRGKKADWVAEAFVCGADGTKAGFIQKPTSWSHQGKPKHDEPMKGGIYIGPLERDESTGVEQLQVGVPVMDGTTAIGSLVVGLRIDKL